MAPGLPELEILAASSSAWCLANAFSSPLTSRILKARSAGETCLSTELRRVGNQAACVEVGSQELKRATEQQRHKPRKKMMKLSNLRKPNQEANALAAG